MRRFGITLLLTLGLLAGPVSEWACPGGSRVQAAEHGDAHAQHIGEDGVSTDPSEFKSDLAIFTFVVFLLLLGVLFKFAWGPISTGLDKREHHIAEQIAAAERANSEAKEMLAQYERKLAGAQDEVRAIIEEARRDATHTQQEILAQARADATAEMDRAKREVQTAADQARRELAETSATLAVELAGKIIRAQLDAGQHARLVSEALSQFHAGSQN
ncbi:MAG TPA: F0F1 ATP synthase subunit B [Pirellulales bacterium]|nr:F0F1 ATP synthase subunit B [Pirellulales bacterium]